MNFEENVEQLEKVVQELENGNLNLDESVKKFEEGMKMAKQCNNILEETEKKITILLENDGELKEENFDNKSFDNVNTSKENWINGTFGIGGFAICCIANYDFARVDVYFGKTNANENKIAFDNVMLHKLEIESNLGVNLEWDRGDDVKRSIISYRLENVSIYNENDWLQIAKFHAKWSKKFIDAIVPYLK